MSSQPISMQVLAASSVETVELGLQIVTKRFVSETLIEEDDPTWIMSDSEDSEYLAQSSEEMDPESEPEEDAGSDSELEWLKEDLSRNVTLVDESRIALKEDGETKKEKAASQSFLLKHEVPRKVFHSFHGLVTIYLYSCGFLQHQIALPLWFLFYGTFLFELLRLNNDTVNNAVLPWVKYFIRDLEMHLWNGIVFYLAGVSLVLTFAPKDIAVMSILLLSWADTAASTVGRAFGKYTPKIAPGKSLAGSLASTCVGAAVCLLFHGVLVPKYESNLPGPMSWTPENSHMSLSVYSIATGIIASVSEAINVAGIDDNFTLPVLSAIFLSVLTSVCHV